MPSLKDLTAQTRRLDQLSSDLHSELTEGAIDFEKMVQLADDIGASSDRLAAAFSTMAAALETSLNGGIDDAGEGDGEQGTESS